MFHFIPNWLCQSRPSFLSTVFGRNPEILSYFAHLFTQKPQPTENTQHKTVFFLIIIATVDFFFFLNKTAIVTV